VIKRAYHLLALFAAVSSCVATALIFTRPDSSFKRAVSVERPPVHWPEITETEPEKLPSRCAWFEPSGSRDAGGAFQLFKPPPMVLDAGTHRYKLSLRQKTELPTDGTLATIVSQSSANRTTGVMPRFQLLGYVQRDAENIGGIFQNIQTSEVRIVLAGSSVDDWRMMIERVELEPARIVNDTLEVQVPQARALVRDELLDCTYPLSTTEVQSPSVNLAEKTNLLVREDFSRDG